MMPGLTVGHYKWFDLFSLRLGALQMFEKDVMTLTSNLNRVTLDAIMRLAWGDSIEIGRPVRRLYTNAGIYQRGSHGSKYSNSGCIFKVESKDL